MAAHNKVNNFRHIPTANDPNLPPRTKTSKKNNIAEKFKHIPIDFRESLKSYINKKSA